MPGARAVCAEGEGPMMGEAPHERKSRRVKVQGDLSHGRLPIAADVADALTAITHLTEDTSPPAWLGKGGEFPPGEIVACANTLLHVGTRKLIAHTPAFFNTTAV